MTLRLKIMIALLVSSLVSLALVGVVANQRLMSRFDDIVLARSQRNFRGDVAAYWLTYGSWQAGALIEPFPQFVQRRRAVLAPAAAGQWATLDTGDAADARPLPPLPPRVAAPPPV